jgi:hypothetical protein
MSACALAGFTSVDDVWFGDFKVASVIFAEVLDGSVSDGFAANGACS